jgi:hypothetical protein
VLLVLTRDPDDDGNSATWGEHVTDEEYNAAPTA